MKDGVFIIGNGKIEELKGILGITPDCPEALFKKNNVVRVRRLKFLMQLPAKGVIVAVVPPGFSPDWAWDDLCGRPRRWMHQVPAKVVKYLVAFEGDRTPHLLREKYLLPSVDPDAVVSFEEVQP